MGGLGSQEVLVNMNKGNYRERIQSIRNYFNMNQINFGAEIGLSQSQYSKIERGKSKPSQTVLYAMMARFGVNLDWVVTGQGEMLLSPEEYFKNGIKLLGKQKIGEGLANVLKDPEFADLQSLVVKDDLIDKNLSDDLRELINHVLQLWQQGDERTRRTLFQFVRAFQDEKGKD